MKKLITKIKLRRKSNNTPTRITNETVAEHRERILAGGRRFKYPVQYARHRLVINAIIISVAAIIALIIVGWWQLYSAQNTSVFMYRVTRVLPVPVASVDGQLVPYSDYLMKYRSSVYYLENKEQISLNTTDGKKQVEYIKQQAMQDSEADAYAKKLAGPLGLSVTDAELESFLKQQRQSSDGEVSQQTYDAVVMDYYNWSPDEYRYATKEKLLRQKVTYAVDKNAAAMVNRISPLAKAPGSDFKAIVKTISALGGLKPVYSSTGWVPKSNQDGGLATAAAGLKKGAVSDAIKPTTGDGYYFVRLIDSNASQVSYEYIKIPLTTFNDNLAALRTQSKIKEFIDIPKATTSTNS